MKLDTVSPQWTYNTDVEALTGMSVVQLLIWPGGLCVSGHSTDGTTMIAKAFSFKEKMAGEVMNAIFMNEPLLAGPQPISKVWIAEPRTLIVPESLYDKRMAADWLSAAYFVEADEDILQHGLPEGQAYALFPVKHNLYMALQQFFPESRTGTFQNSRINCSREQPDIGFMANIIILGKTAVMSFEENGRFLLQQLQHYETVEDIVFGIAAVSGRYNHSTADTAVLLSGVQADVSYLSAEIALYYPHTQLCDDTSTLDFLKNLSLCAL